MKFRLPCCLLKDRACDWWEEVGHALGSKVVEEMTWEDFVTKFMDDLAPMIEVQQLVKEILDLYQTTENVAEITAMFRERAFKNIHLVLHQVYTLFK